MNESLRDQALSHLKCSQGCSKRQMPEQTSRYRILDFYIDSSSMCSHHLLITSLITLKELLTGMKELPMQENEAVFLWPHFYQNDTYF